MLKPTFFNRDLSWLVFNERVLMEAEKASVPLMERIKFLSIYSSNLDEFYRVRMPALLALQKIGNEEEISSIFKQSEVIINNQLNLFGKILIDKILPALKRGGYYFLYKKSIPVALYEQVSHYFFTQVAGMLNFIPLSGKVKFFPENNFLYMVVILQDNNKKERLVLINIPSNELKRFLFLPSDSKKYILFLEDIIQHHLPQLFPGEEIIGSYNIKITRDADLSLSDDFGKDIAIKIEKQLAKRDQGFATRFLYQPGIPMRHLQNIKEIFNLNKASVVEGGKYHNLIDLSSLPVNDARFDYPAWPGHQIKIIQKTLFEDISANDTMLHTPYQSYDRVLRFFNEASIDPSVVEISTTLYRVASDSRIVHALINAAKNGKVVTVIVELKARFDEANNIRWAKRMKANGIKILYSSNSLKVHAKIALVKRKHPTHPYLGLLATGNLNERTARFYTDHVLLTANRKIVDELQILFDLLSKKKNTPEKAPEIFEHLLVAQFNLQERFLVLIDKEIENVKNGLPAYIIIKLNNLEEEVLIKKLYEASNAGVKIQLLVRGICRLIPGLRNQSANITITRIIDRFLEHGRIFIFCNNNEEQIFMGSADWMSRNIYRRIEVCFPVYDNLIKAQIMHIIQLQLLDNIQAVRINSASENIIIRKEPKAKAMRSQEAIYEYLKNIH